MTAAAPLADALAGFLTAAADHWAAVRTAADVTADPVLREYTDAVSAEADATVALALALADRAPGHEIAVARRIRRMTIAARRAAGRRAGIPTLPAALVAARADLWAAAGWPVGGAAAALPPRAREVAA
ncbi:hypothetical protein [Frankia sp. Cppng1_Ct_nod]|uniref:hypothetical protein n=1 Tax=Frankia sp. Cppng1_Ct_nod TaxID=2897162 RepID=UPI0010417134|nr:hypothetical protein [Frankia sp. Cppng1_Ct_nod]